MFCRQNEDVSFEDDHSDHRLCESSRRGNFDGHIPQNHRQLCELFKSAVQYKNSENTKRKTRVFNFMFIF